MMKNLISFLLLFPFLSFSQTDYKIVTYKKASDEIYAEILDAENSLKKGKSQYWVRTEKIVCLSNITPKESDHQYQGMLFKPNGEEIKKWKNWFKKNKGYLKYMTDAATGKKFIVYHNPKEQIKLSDCFF